MHRHTPKILTECYTEDRQSMLYFIQTLALITPWWKWTVCGIFHGFILLKLRRLQQCIKYTCIRRGDSLETIKCHIRNSQILRADEDSNLDLRSRVRLVAVSLKRFHCLSLSLLPRHASDRFLKYNPENWINFDWLTE